MNVKDTAAPTVKAELRAARWTGARTFTIKGWAYMPQRPSTAATPDVKVWLQDETGNRAPALVRPYTDPEANGRSGSAPFEASGCAFEALFDFDAQLGTASVRGKFLTVHVSVSDGTQTHETTLTGRYRWGSAGALEACSFDNGVQVVPSWTRDGLRFKVAKRIAVACAFSFEDDELRFWVRTDGRFAPDRAVLRDDREREIEASSFKREGNWVEFVFTTHKLPALEDVRDTWRFYLRAGEQDRLVHWNNLLTPNDKRADGFILSAGPSGVVRLDRLHHNIEARALEFHDLPYPHLTVTGSYAGEHSKPASLSLDGQRDSISGSLITNDAGQFVYSVPLTRHSETGALAITSGGYRISIQFADESVERLRPAKSLTARLHKAYYSKLLNVRLERSPADEVYVNVSPPLSPNELGEYNQRKLSAASRTGADLSDGTFYFESWFGKNFSDSPLALFKEARRRLPAAQLYVSVADMSVSLPEGAIPVVRNSLKSWQALATSKYVVTNCWAPDKYKRHPEQVLVQTWHGTPLKLLGLDRPGSREQAGRVAKIKRESNDWSLLISQNPHSTGVFRQAYAYEGEIIESGYPRNDALFDSSELRREVRESLNLPPERTVVLYAPTWREDSAGSPDLIQAGAMAAALGPDFTVLLRGHSVSLRRGEDVKATGVLDVTSFNDPSGLMAAADVLVTDYSSIMFDFSVTGKPLIFYVPDWDSYTGAGRGVYFDLADKAPGPLCHTRDEVIVALKDLAACRDVYASAYGEWRKEFNPWDQPSSSAQVLSRILELSNAPAKV